MSPTSPCPYPPELLAAQRARLQAARRSLWRRLPAELRSSRSPDAAAGGWQGAAAPVAAARLSPAERASALAGLPFSLSPAELVTDLAASAAAALAAVDAALARLDAGCYGWDAAAGRWIPAARLQALPSAAACLPDEESLP